MISSILLRAMPEGQQQKAVCFGKANFCYLLYLCNKAMVFYYHGFVDVLYDCTCQREVCVIINYTIWHTYWSLSFFVVSHNGLGSSLMCLLGPFTKYVTLQGVGGCLTWSHISCTRVRRVSQPLQLNGEATILLNL